MGAGRRRAHRPDRQGYLVSAVTCADLISLTCRASPQLPDTIKPECRGGSLWRPTPKPEGRHSGTRRGESLWRLPPKPEGRRVLLSNTLRRGGECVGRRRFLRRPTVSPPTPLTGGGCGTIGQRRERRAATFPSTTDCPAFSIKGRRLTRSTAPRPAKPV